MSLVLFDLGGVLIEVAGVRAMLELTGIESEEELSFELGVLQPDIAAFAQVADLLEVPAGGVPFLDDNAVNVAGAAAAGFQAACAAGVGEARASLRSYLGGAFEATAFTAVVRETPDAPRSAPLKRPPPRAFGSAPSPPK